MKIIAVGDLHHGPNFEQIETTIEREQPDLTVFVGDYFDQFYDHTDEALLTAKWLKESLEKPKRVHLWGNHDLPYAYPTYISCQGYTSEKARAIREVLGAEDWRKLKLWHFCGGWLFTHAGLPLRNAPSNLAKLDDFLRTEEEAAWTALWAHQEHWIWSIGRARGGDAPAGGLLWCDWPREFVPVPGLNQVLGHTPAKEIRVKRGPASENWCIDLTSRTGITHLLALEGTTARPAEVQQ